MRREIPFEQARTTEEIALVVRRALRTGDDELLVKAFYSSYLTLLGPFREELGDKTYLQVLQKVSPLYRDELIKKISDSRLSKEYRDQCLSDLRKMV